MISISARFIEYLKGQGVSKNTAKNYRSDLNEFEQFIIQKLQGLNNAVDTLDQSLPFLRPGLAEDFKKSLETKNGSPKSVNRSLSTLRKFSGFLVDSGLLYSDFTRDLVNLPNSRPHTLDSNELRRSYEAHLIKNRFSRNTIKNYLSDIRQFLNSFGDRDPSTVTFIDVRKYFLESLKYTPLSSSDRKLSSLHGFFEWLRKNGAVHDNPVADYIRERELIFPKKIKQINLQTPALRGKIIASFAGNPKAQKTLHGIFYTRPEWYRKYQINTLARLISLGLFISLAVGLGIGINEQFFAQPSAPLAYPIPVKTAKKYLSFEGKLLDENSAPVTETKNVVFRLYSEAVNGTPLWTGTCYISPDKDGRFSTLLGSDCGSEIEASVFSDNPHVWLGITVDQDAETEPRIQIAAVGYAQSAGSIQDYSITATGAATANSIVTMNNDGLIVIGETGPKITSLSGTFAIEGQALTLQTAPNTGGDINLVPDATGTVNIIANTQSEDALYITNSQLVNGAVIHGYYGGIGGTTDLIRLSSGDPETDKFRVKSDGSVFIAGDLTAKSIASLSDTRLKENISPIDSALKKVSALRGITFYWKGDPQRKKSMGFLAQEVAQVAPELVNEDTNGFLSLKYDEITALLVEAVKDISGTISDGYLSLRQLTSPDIKTAMISPLTDGGLVTITADTTVEGKLTAGEIEAENIEADTINAKNIDEIESLLKKVESDQQVMAEALDWSKNIATSSAVISDLFATNQIAANALSITTSLAVGTDMVIANTSNSINTLLAPLSLQSLALAPVEIMAGKFRISTSGDVEITGNLKVAGNIEAKELSLEKLIIANSSTSEESVPATSEVTLDGSSEVKSNAMAGQAVLSAGIDEVTIKNPEINTNTLIYITPSSSTLNTVLFVKAKGEGYFKAGFLTPLDIDVSFNWWIIELYQN